MKRVARESLIADGLTNGVFAGKELLRHHFVDDHDWKMRAVVSFGKEAPAEETRLGAGAVARRHRPLPRKPMCAIPRAAKHTIGTCAEAKSAGQVRAADSRRLGAA